MRNFFEALCGAILMALCIVLRPLFRPWYAKWGATKEEINMRLPGDELVPEPRGGYTQAVSIQVPAGNVWPWVAQTGQGKGGFYSYELLENLVGCDIHNVPRVLPEYQDVKPGDSIVMHPKMPGIPIVSVEPGRTLVAGGSAGETTSNNWIFHIEENNGTSRLITRWSFQYISGLANRIGYNWVLEPIAAVMQRKMLKTMKKLAESLPKT